MSFDDNSEFQEDKDRKSAHVKWDGKTIALGTFSAQEAIEKCNRAKTLTKKWRTTMVPKPNAEWVKSTLERLNIRVVNDRPGRRKKRDNHEPEDMSTSKSASTSSKQKRTNRKKNKRNAIALPSSMIGSPPEVPFQAMDRDFNSSFSNFGVFGGSSSLQRRLSDPSQFASGQNSQLMPMSNPLFASLSTNYYGASNPMPMHDRRQENNVGIGIGGTFDEAVRMGRGSQNTQQQLASLTFGSVQHYQVLKEHHANLIRELQHTTTLMNMYHNNSGKSSNNQLNYTRINTGMQSSDQMNQMNPVRTQNRENMDQLLDQNMLSNPFYPQSLQNRDSLNIRNPMKGAEIHQQGQNLYSSMGANQY